MAFESIEILSSFAGLKSRYRKPFITHGTAASLELCLDRLTATLLINF